MNTMLIYGECYKNNDNLGSNIYKMHKNSTFVDWLSPFCL